MAVGALRTPRDGIGGMREPGTWDGAELTGPVSLSSCNCGTRHDPDPQTGQCQCRQLSVQQSSFSRGFGDFLWLDEAIAASALTSLSCGPSVLGSTDHPHDPGSGNTAITSVCSRMRGCDLYVKMCAPSTPSLPLISKNSTAQPDSTVDDSDTTLFLFGDPVPRKRKNSGRLMYRCLWKNCGKVLSTCTAIQKHIRAAHLGRCVEQEHNDGEEDFYYTEIDVNIDTLSDGLSNLTPTSPTTSGPLPFPYAVSLGAASGTELPVVSPLSLSAPSNLCHVHSDHAYQALSPITVCASSKVGLSFESPPLIIKASPVRPMTMTPVCNARPITGTRKPRGEAKKCRKVYGMERRDMWCTACRWKKACQRFID